MHTVCSIWPIDIILSGTTTPGQTGPWNNGNEGVLHILQIFKAGASPSDSLMPYPEHSGGALLRAILNKSWRQHPTKQQLYDHLPPITKTIQVRRTRHAGYCWRSKDELISDIFRWTPSNGQAKARRPTYIQQLSADTGYSLEDTPGAIDDIDGWWERVSEIRAGSVTWGLW